MAITKCPTPSSSWVPSAPKEVHEAAGGAMDAVWNHFCPVRPWIDEEEPQELGEPKAPVGILGLGSSVWQHKGALNWDLLPAKNVEIPGDTSTQVDVFVKGTATRSGGANQPL